VELLTKSTIAGDDGGGKVFLAGGDRRGRSELPRQFQIALLQVHREDCFVAERAQRGDRHQPDTAGAYHHDRIGRGGRKGLARGTVGGQAGAGESCGPPLFDPGDVEEVTGVRDEDKLGIPAVAGDAEVTGRGAQVLVTCLACVAGAVADPWVDKAMLTRRDPVGVGAGRFDDADDLMAEDKRVGDAPVDQIQTPPAAEIVVPLTQVHVGVAHPGANNAEEHFGALGRWCRQFHIGHGVVVLEDRERVHGCPRR
jgi:hypothetical protein